MVAMPVANTAVGEPAGRPVSASFTAELPNRKPTQIREMTARAHSMSMPP
jgi:hypothetical protein